MLLSYFFFISFKIRDTRASHQVSQHQTLTLLFSTETLLHLTLSYLEEKSKVRAC